MKINIIFLFLLIYSTAVFPNDIAIYGDELKSQYNSHPNMLLFQTTKKASGVAIKCQLQKTNGISIPEAFFIMEPLATLEVYEGVTDTASIRWVNDCECILTKLNPSSNQDKRPIQIKILSTKENSYTFEYSLVGDNANKQRGTIQKIK